MTFEQALQFVPTRLEWLVPPGIPPVWLWLWIICPLANFRRHPLTQQNGYQESSKCTIKVKLHYAYKVRNIGRVRPKLRFSVLC